MKLSAAARGRARRIAMQAIYQWEVTGNALHVIDAECHVENDMEKVDVEYFTELFHGVAKEKAELDSVFAPYLMNITMAKVDPISLATLRLAVFELKNRIDVPYRVIINEAINIAKKYGAADSHKFINGMLDKVALQLREAEVLDNKNKKRK